MKKKQKNIGSKLFMRVVITAFISNLIILSNSQAGYYQNNCQQLDLGWHFYCDPNKPQPTEPQELAEEITSSEQKSEDHKTSSNNINISIGELANQIVEERKEKQMTLLNTAIVFPSEENITRYLSYNLEMLGDASYFGKKAERMTWQHSELNYALKNPPSGAAKKVWIDQRNAVQKEAALNINERFGVFFIYRSDCPYCHKYSPIIRRFSDKYGIAVKAISADGGILPLWPDSVTDQGQIKILGVEAYPATILFDKEVGGVIPIGYGVLSETELLNQIYQLTEVADENI